MDKVRKLHVYDGSASAGKPIGPILTVISTKPHKPVDGPGCGIVCRLSDGTWEFSHNLHYMEKT